MVEYIQRRRLFQQVQERLSTRIRAGEFDPGDQLPSERTLMREYGVGRSAIREALQSMERDGIVSIQHGERAKVLIPSASQLIDQMSEATRHLLNVDPRCLDHLKDARLFLEVGLAERAAWQANDESIRRLQSCLRAHDDAATELEEFLDKDMEFHREIAAISNNPIFPAVIEAMFHWLRHYRMDLFRTKEAEPRTLAEHRRIFDAIRNRNPKEAGVAMRDHINRVNSLYRQVERH